MSNLYLFSIDLEDVRLWMPDGEKYRPRVVQNTLEYLQWLDGHDFKATFFTVGNIARTYPDLVKEIVGRGHEVACHSNEHIPLDKQSKEEFKRDLCENIEALYKAGASKINGYRAPVFSITPNTSWAYEILEQEGIKYSSSVLPENNPLYGWPEFGQHPRKMENGIWEIPATTGKFGPLKTPFAGGVYFRVFPFFLIKKAFMEHKDSPHAITGYFHPYDIDTLQERFMHPGINNNPLYNQLMYFNRKNVFKRLDKVIGKGFEVTTYSENVGKLNLGK